jgi:cytochrome c peroxidase
MWLILALALAIPLGLDLYLPVPEDNPITTEKIDLGRLLFNDQRLSRDGTIACVSCHEADRAFADGRVVPTGVFGRQGRRNAPAIVNRGYGRLFFWDGRAHTLEEQVLKPIQDPNEMDLTLVEASSRVGVSVDNISRALASYVRSIMTGDAPYDRFINGDRMALTEEEQRGLQLFRGKANCTACHVGPTLSDERLHNTGVAWAGEAGRVEGAGTAGGAGGFKDVGAGRGDFKTPTLREVARTAPYMHDGSLTTLDEVVAYYNRGGNANPSLDPELRPLHLEPEDMRALVSFLRTLSGTIHEGP